MLGVGDVVPSESAIRRTLDAVDNGRFDTIVNAWMPLQFSVIGDQQVMGFDGRSVRPHRRFRRYRPHLLAAMDQKAQW